MFAFYLRIEEWDFRGLPKGSYTKLELDFIPKINYELVLCSVITMCMYIHGVCMGRGHACAMAGVWRPEEHF